MSPAAPPPAIHLSPLSSSPAATTADAKVPLSSSFSPAPSPFSLSAKDSFLSSFPGEPVEPNPSRRRAAWTYTLPTWDQLDTALWAAVPLVLHLLPIVLLLVAMLSRSPDRACMSMTRTDGTSGRLDWFILSSCVTPINGSSYTCTSYGTTNDFAPSVVPLLSSLPGFSALYLPQQETQIPTVFITTVALLSASFVVYLPLWILAYFPHSNYLPSFVVRFYRYFSYKLFLLVGLLAFVGFLFSTTIGVGYKLYLMTAKNHFLVWYKYGLYAEKKTVAEWSLHVGKGFDLVWIASTVAGLAVVAVNVALHNGFDERVEWPDNARR